MITSKKVNVLSKFEAISDYWNPRIVGELNNQYVKLAKLKGEFIWHSHENEDELFYVVKGQLKIELRDGEVTLDKGEFYIVPKGVEHKPIAENEVSVLFFEPKTTVNTGKIENNLTRKNLDIL